MRCPSKVVDEGWNPFRVTYREVEQLVARRAHNPKVVGSSPTFAITVLYLWLINTLNKYLSMPRKQYKYHFIYKTTCLLTQKFYVGMHSTNDVADGYIGSGKILRYSLIKHGKGNHIREILEYLPDRISLKDREKELINLELLKDPLCMNLMIGGEGGLNGKNGFLNKEIAIKARIKTNKILIEKLFNDLDYRNRFCKNVSNGLKKRLETEPHNWTGRNHKQDSKDKIGLANSISQKGERNSQFGKCWIHNIELKQSKSIKKEDLNFYLTEGWIKGRKLKY